MVNKTTILLIASSSVAIGFFAIYVMAPAIVLGPTLAGLKDADGNIVEHCSLNSDAIVNQQRPEGVSSVSAQDDNIRLTLFVDDANVTEFEDQTFSVEVYNKARLPLVFPSLRGDPYAITGYNKMGAILFTLGGKYQSFGLHDFSPPTKPACYINSGESATFDALYRIGTIDHSTTTIAYLAASVDYAIGGEEKMLQTLDDKNQGDSSDGIDIRRYSEQLLRIVVAPISLPELDTYFDAALAFPYMPKLGEEKPLYAIAQSEHYVGPYTLDVYLPEGIRLISGRTHIEGDFPSESYIDEHGKPVSPIVEQHTAILNVRPEKAGNYALQATIYSIFNGTRVGNHNTIWLSVQDNGTSFVSWEELPNSTSPAVKPGNDVSRIIQDKDPIPHVQIVSPSVRGEITQEPAGTDFSWPDGINWMEKMPKSIFATVNPSFVPQIEVSVQESSREYNHTTSVRNNTSIRISIENSELPPSLLVVDFYNHKDILNRRTNVSSPISVCNIYAPTTVYHNSSFYDQCPIEKSIVIRNSTDDFVSSRQATQNEKQEYAYDLEISAKKSGLYTVYVYAQWASTEEIKLNEKYRTSNSQFKLQIETDR